MKTNWVFESQMSKKNSQSVLCAFLFVFQYVVKNWNFWSEFSNITPCIVLSLESRLRIRWLLWNSWSIQLHWMTCRSDARYVNGLSWERSAWRWSSKLRMKSIKVMISMYQWRHQYTLMIQELVTVGMLRSPELPPPPAWNDDDKSNTSDATFQSCYVSVVHTNQKELI